VPHGEDLDDVVFGSQSVVDVVANAAEVDSSDAFVVGRVHAFADIGLLGDGSESSAEIVGEGFGSFRPVLRPPRERVRNLDRRAS